MNFQIVTTLHFGRQRPVHVQPLTACLKILGVRGRRSGRLCKAWVPAQEMWEWLEQAKRNHRQLIRKHHPDRCGSHERAAVINAAWDRVKELLERRGIGFS